MFRPADLVPRNSSPHVRGLGRLALTTGLACASLLSACVDAEDASVEPPAAETAPEREIQADVDTVLAALSALDELVHHGQLTSQLTSSYDRIELAIVAVAEAAQELRDAAPRATAVRQLSLRAGQLAPRLRELKRAIVRSSLDTAARADLMAALSRVQVSARSLDQHVGEYHAELHAQELAALGPAARRNGPLYPGSTYYTLDRGHVDVVDAAYADGALEVSIHDESVVPDVERDPAHVILVVKSEAKLQVPDSRFAFLGPIGSDVWVLPQGQLEAEALGVLWPGLSSEEIELGTFTNDAVQIRFKQVIGPDGLSLFESPQDETTPPTVVVDSEDGLPDSIVLAAGTHRHLNWAFESPGIYFVKVEVRGQLAGVPGTPWVSSAITTLKFVVLP